MAKKSLQNEPITPLSREEKKALCARAEEQGRTVEFIFARDQHKKLRCVRAVIRDQAWVLAQKVAA